MICDWILKRGLIHTIVIGFAKTILNGTFSISRNTILKYCNNCVALVPHYSRARLAI